MLHYTILYDSIGLFLFAPKAERQTSACKGSGLRAEIGSGFGVQGLGLRVPLAELKKRLL